MTVENWGNLGTRMHAFGGFAWESHDRPMQYVPAPEVGSRMAREQVRWMKAVRI